MDFATALKVGLKGATSDACSHDMSELARKLNHAFKVHFGDGSLRVTVEYVDNRFLFHASGSKGSAQMFQVWPLRTGWPMTLAIPHLSVTIDCDDLVSLNRNVSNALAHPRFASFLLGLR